LTERVVVLEAIYPAINTWGESIESIHPLAETEPTATASLATKHKRYWIEPATLLQAQKYARDRGWDIIGIYHSHPDHPALPSECDRQWAWSDYSYMIVSVTQAKADPIQSWVLDGQHQFQSEPILTQSSPAAC
jgi:proteasome lid subunit RPN8/RPN11